MYCREKVLGKTALIFQDQYVFVLPIALPDPVPCLHNSNYKDKFGRKPMQCGIQTLQKILSNYKSTFGWPPNSTCLPGHQMDCGLVSYLIVNNWREIPD